VVLVADAYLVAYGEDAHRRTPRCDEPGAELGGLPQFSERRSLELHGPGGEGEAGMQVQFLSVRGFLGPEQAPEKAPEAAFDAADLFIGGENVACEDSLE
jgi:hypothetical protein